MDELEPGTPAPGPTAPDAPAAPVPGDAEPGRNPVPVIPSAKAAGRSLLATGCLVLVASLVVSVVAGGAAGYTAVRFVGGGASTGPAEVRVVGGTTDEPVSAAAAAALPSVVNVDVSSPGTATTGSSRGGLPQGHPGVPQGGTGSGVAFRAADGGGTFILTNNHVVEDMVTIVVTASDGEPMKATLVGRDPDTDIAVVKVGRSLPLIKIGDSEKLIVGQLVVAIGSPFGLQHSVSSGVVSALHRALPGGSSDGSSSATPLIDVIQTDAAINPGNSGGALVDRRGRLIGIDTAIYSGSGQSAGIGFAIPAETALRIADELIAGGKAKHPFLGIEGRTVDAALAKDRKLPASEGAILERVFASTGAERAGLRKGDIIVGFDSQPVRSMDDLLLRTRRTRVGDHVKLEVWRDGKKITVAMTVGDKPAVLK
jgi:serine protease DegQ